LLELFWTFFKIGLFTFGGGYAMIAIIEDTCVEEKKWISREKMMELIVIAESTPGPIAINCATYIGYLQKGMLGAIAGTAGMIGPSLIIIYTISRFFDRFLEIAVVASAFRGIKVGVGIIIINAGLKMLKDVPKEKLSRTIVLCAAVAMLVIKLFSLNISSVVLLIAAGVIGIVACRVKGGAAK